MTSLYVLNIENQMHFLKLAFGELHDFDAESPTDWHGRLAVQWDGDGKGKRRKERKCLRYVTKCRMNIAVILKLAQKQVELTLTSAILSCRAELKQGQKNVI